MHFSLRPRTAGLALSVSVAILLAPTAASAFRRFERYTQPFRRQRGLSTQAQPTKQSPGRATRTLRMPRRIQESFERTGANPSGRGRPRLDPQIAAQAAMMGEAATVQHFSRRLPVMRPQIVDAYLDDDAEGKGDFVRKFTGGMEGAYDATREAWRRAQAAITAGNMEEVSIETTGDGASFVTVDIEREVGTVQRAPREGDERVQEPATVTHVTMLIRNGSLSRAFPAWRPRSFGNRDSHRATDAAIRSGEPPNLADNAIQRYLQDEPEPYRAQNLEPRGHAVFDGVDARSVVNEAWDIARQALESGAPVEGVEVDHDNRGPATFITVEMGRRVGYIGGRLGALNNHPDATRIQMVVENGQVKWAYPMSYGFEALRFEGGPTVGGVRLPAPATATPVEHPPRAFTFAEVASRLASRVGGDESARSGMVRAIARRGVTPPFIAELRQIVRRAQESGSLRERRAAAEIQESIRGIVHAQLRPGDGPARNVMIGMPSPATTESRTDRLVVRNGFVSSMREGVGVNWVSYVVGPTDLGASGRAEDFRADPTLPADWDGNTDEAMGEMGRFDFHRGHLAPSGERNVDSHINSSTFTYANVIPQAANNNTGPWNGLEQYTRLMQRQGYVCHVVAGGLYLGPPRSVGQGVRAPSHTWKVITVTRPGQTSRDIDAGTRVIAVLMPNNNYEVAQNGDWTQYRVAPDLIEGLSARTDNAGVSLRFFDHLPSTVADALRAQVDSHEVPSSITQMRSFLPAAVERIFPRITYRAPDRAVGAAPLRGVPEPTPLTAEAAVVGAEPISPRGSE